MDDFIPTHQLIIEASHMPTSDAVDRCVENVFVYPVHYSKRKTIKPADQHIATEG